MFRTVIKNIVPCVLSTDHIRIGIIAVSENLFKVYIIALLNSSNKIYSKIGLYYSNTTRK